MLTIRISKKDTSAVKNELRHLYKLQTILSNVANTEAANYPGKTPS